MLSLSSVAHRPEVPDSVSETVATSRALSEVLSMPIIPAKRPMVFQSIISAAASFRQTTPKETTTSAPSKAATVLCASSVAMTINTATKTVTAKISSTAAV